MFPSYIAGAHDVAAEAQNGEDVLITLIQDPLLELSPSILDKEYTVTLETTGGWLKFSSTHTHELLEFNEGISVADVLYRSRPWESTLCWFFE